MYNDSETNKNLNTVDSSIPLEMESINHDRETVLNMIKNTPHLVTDNDLLQLKGIDQLDMSNCTQVTDAGLMHLMGILYLKISGCTIY